MSAQAKPSEPSMEEILASIRRIISDDETKPAEEAAAPQVDVAPEPEPAPVAVIDDDVLDLGAEAALIAAPAPEPAPVPPAAIADDSDVAFLDEEPAAALPPEPPAPPAEPPPVLARPEPSQPAFAAVPDMASLLSDQASSVVTNAFGQLASTVLSNNARTLEDLVKDMLKPMLKTWLDDNLPTMVERLVRTEIERVARGGRS
ncbi:PopZ family protein [Bosea sp. UC22_33]|uniref:PopZ family protein n=1 Tax=Bosea sp. UC22_33 TaxID=3350165 RepID=UPI00366E6763